MSDYQFTIVAFVALMLSIIVGARIADNVTAAASHPPASCIGVPHDDAR